MNKDTPQSNTDWRKEFENYWVSTSAWNLHPHDMRPVETFISQLLEAEKKRIVGMLEPYTICHLDCEREFDEDKPCDCGLDAVLQKLS